MSDNYFVISQDEDGEWDVRQLSKSQLEQEIETKNKCGESLNYYDKLPKNFGAGEIIIKGEIVVPKPVSVVTKYEV